MKRKKNKAIIIILSTLAFILLAAGVFYGTYYLIMDRSSSSYENTVKTIVNKINEVNSSTSDLLKGQAIDPEKIRKDLAGKIDSLSKEKEELSGITATDKYVKVHDNLISGLDKNILMYRQIDAIVANPVGKDLDKAGENLKKYRDDALSNYTLVNIKGLKISLPESSIKLVDYTSNFVNERVKLNRDKEISQSQNLAFINSLDELVSRYSAINSDLSVQMAKVRNEKGNMDNVIALADKNKDELASIHQEFSSLTVPSKAAACYKLFGKTLESLDAYLESFSYSASNEKLLGDNVNSDKLKEIYSETNSLYTQLTKDYNNFLKSYSEFREASSNQ